MKQRIAGWLAPLLILMAGLAMGFIIGKDRGLARVGMVPSEYSGMVAQSDGSVILANEPNMDDKAWSHQVDSTSSLIRQIEVVAQPKEDSAEFERLLKSNGAQGWIRPKAVRIYLSVIVMHDGISKVIASSCDARILYGKQYTGFARSAEKRKWADMFSFAGFTRRPISDLTSRLKPYSISVGASLATKTAGSATGAATRT